MGRAGYDKILHKKVAGVVDPYDGLHYEHTEAFATDSTERTLINHWVQLENVAMPGKTLRVREDGGADGLGGWGAWTHFKVVAGGGGTVTLWNNEWKTCLRHYKGTVAGGGNGGPDCLLNIVRNEKNPKAASLQFANLGAGGAVGIDNKRNACLAGKGGYSQFIIHVVGNEGDGERQKFLESKASFEDEKIMFDQKYQAFKKEVSRYEAEQLKYQAQMAELTRRQGAYQTQLGAYTNDYNNLMAGQRSYQSAVKTYQVDYRALQTSSAELERQNRAMEQQERQLAQQQRQLEQQVNATKSKLAQITASARDVVARCDHEAFMRATR